MCASKKTLYKTHCVTFSVAINIQKGKNTILKFKSKSVLYFNSNYQPLNKETEAIAEIIN